MAALAKDSLTPAQFFESIACTPTEMTDLVRHIVQIGQRILFIIPMRRVAGQWTPRDWSFCALDSLRVNIY